ncbi:MAG TPA: ABATE domain-containing protein [Vicinamibacteria bacterium]|nr:ABATE domain-containing protein [Vicinamibacteria bacterium]
MAGRRIFELSGGRLCLDFVNTVDNRPTDRAQDLLETFADLALWSRQSGILSPREERALLGRAEREPARARKVLSCARLLREALFAIFSRGTPSALEALRKTLPTAYRRPVLRSGPGYELFWDEDPKTLDRMLGPVLRSAVELLTSKELGRVRVCGADNCDWLFLDESRSRSRQWCNMAVCGNRAKARRFYQRQRRRFLKRLKRRGNRAGRRSAGTRGEPSRE